LVEDEPALVPVLCQALSESGFVVTRSVSGREGARSLVEGHFAFALVDLMLPGLSGFEVIRMAREAGIQTPILVLSARGGTQDMVKALDLGADDYLAKPFKTDELLARIRALLRRASAPSNVLACGDLALDLDARTVTRAGRPVVLSQKEFAMLEVLLRNVGTPLSKAALLAQVWRGKSMISDNIVEVYAGYLRQKTEEGGGSRLIHTVRGAGYMASEHAPV
jgi:DNA-binding response OmpR family regulator